MEKRLLLKELSRYRIGTYADIIYRNSLLFPDKEVFIYGERRVTFSGFNARVNRLILYRHPGVLEAAVIGVPDDRWVERVHAVIVPKEGAKISPEEIIDFCRQHIARYKAPRSVEFVPSLPKNPQGKILKRELRQRYKKD
jgi:acyl-coenzyme A synthetase/AMP-(fatty) acid ligase